MKKFVISFAVALGVLIPYVAFAQTASNGLLTVYVQVLTQNGVNYQQYTPSNFTVAVSGVSPSLNNFPGSQSGTAVTLNPGVYNVTVTNTVPGFIPSYSVGCNSTMLANQSQTCVITMTPSYGSYNPYPTLFPYQSYQPLTCQTLTPTVGLGQQASFNAIGGAGGTYNWATAYQNYPNVGPTLTTAFQASGVHTVTVTNASQTASCVITVNTNYAPVNPINPPAYTTPGYTGYAYGAYNTQPSYTSVVYPRLPSTGFGPKDISTGIAFATVLLITAGLMLSPYVRKTVTALSR